MTYQISSVDDLTLVKAIRTAFKDNQQFWCGYEEVRGVPSGKRLVIFYEGSNSFAFDIPIGESKGRHITTFAAKFRAVDLAPSKCPVCGKPDSNPAICPLFVCYSEALREVNRVVGPRTLRL